MEGLRRSAWLVIAAALLPLLLFLIFQTGYAAREQRRTIEAAAAAEAASIVNRADGEVKRHFAALDALATSASVRAGNTAFRNRALEIVALNQDWVAVEHLDRDGRRLAATDSAVRRIRLVPGSAGPHPRFAGFARGANCPCVLFDRAASDGGLVRVFVATSGFGALLPSPNETYKVSALVSADGRFVARTVEPVERFAALASRFVRAAAASGEPSGLYRGVTLEGFENYTAYARSPLTQWSAHVALGSDYIDGPGRRFLASIGLAALISLLLAALLTWFAIRQVGEGRRIAARFEQSQKLEALGRLTGGIAHDFNNLLTPIVGALDILARRADIDARGKRLALGALASAERAAKLTAQLLAFSRRQKLNVEPIDVGAMLDDMASLIDQSTGGSHPLDIVRPEGMVCAYSDLNQLELAILNLVLNARDASREGTPIRIVLEVAGQGEGARTLIRVIDQGSGMSEEVRRRALEPFFTTKSSGRGTGLGLAQVFGVVEQSGGSVDIATAPGEGTTVTITLRGCDPGEVRRPAEAQLGAGEVPERKLRLLVVDDDHAVRATIARPLEEAGHCVDSVSSGTIALAALEEEPFDLVLVDFAMPRMDGAELIRRARALRPETRFLMITGYSDSDAVAEAAPDVPIVKKPFHAEDLLARVRALAG